MFYDCKHVEKIKSHPLQRDQKRQQPGLLSIVTIMKKEEEREVKPQEILQDSAGSVQNEAKVGLLRVCEIEFIILLVFIN